MTGLPGDENPNPQWKLPPQGRSSWESQWQSGSPLGEQEAQEQRPPSQPNPQWQPGTPTPGKAIAALVLSIVGILFCPYVFSVLGLVLGYRARGEIQRSAGALGGEGLALAAIIISWAGLAVWTLFLVAVIAS